MNAKVEKIIKHLNLEPHPEGGYFSETYRSGLQLTELESFQGTRACSTGIYFLLTSGSISHLHKIRSDEMWHFYSGDPLRIVMLDGNGHYADKILGADLEKGESFQVVVPAGVWFGAEVVDGGTYALVGCTVSPGFDFSDFELAKKETMRELFPNHGPFVEKFCLN